MKNSLIFFTALFLSAVYISFAESPKDMLLSPKLSLSCGDHYDFGNVKFQEKPLKCTIYVKNIGNDTLEIQKIQPSCGCTTAKLYEKFVLPGDSVPINIELIIVKRYGQLKKKVVIVSNDVTDSVYSVYLSAFVNTGYKLQPSMFQIQHAEISKEYSVTFSFENTSEQDYVIDSIAFTPNDLTIIGIESGNTVKAGDKTLFAVVYTPLEPCRISSKVTLYSHNNPDMSNITIVGVIRTEKKPEARK